MHSSIAIDIDASPETVYRLARDVTRWDRLLPHYVSSRATDAPVADGEVVVDFIARRAIVRILGIGLPVIWRARTWSEPGTRRLRFVHVAGATKGMDVTWRLEPRPDGGTRVTIEHAFAPRIPGFAVFVDRAFTQPIAGRTLATFKAIAEAVAEAADAAPEDADRAAGTVPSTGMEPPDA